MERKARTTTVDERRRELVADGLLRIPEACKLAGVGRATLYKWFREGLPFVMVGSGAGRGRRVPRRGLEEFLAARVRQQRVPGE